MLIITFMIYIQATYGKEFSQRVMNNNFNLISSKVKDNLKTLDKVNGFVIDAISSSFSDVQSIEDIEKDKDKYIKILVNILKNNEELYATYFAFSDDSFFEIINLEINKSLREQYTLSKEARWLLVYINGKNKNKRVLNVYNEKLKLIKKEEKENSYLATSRPWYIKAQNQSNILIKSKPYSFKHIDSTGMTYAKRYNENVTFALDVLLNNLNKTINGLNSMKSMNSFLFAEDKDLIGSTTKDTTLISQIKNLIDKNSVLNKKEHIYKINSEKYIINFSQLEDDIYKYLITVVSFDDVMEQYSKYFNLIVVFTILLFLFLLPLIWYFASVIVKPVLELKLESKKVKNRKYSKLRKVKSRVFEIQELSNSMLEMGHSIFEYQNKLEQKVKERTKELREKNIELERLSVTDKLTNIYNRIKLDEVILEELNRADRYNEKFGIMIIDVDYFKQVNDTYGHQVGDSTLIEISKLLQGNIRKSDTVGRWGGEEFVIICPHTDLKGLHELANHIREKIAKHSFPVIGNKTASFGITIYKEEDNLEKLINRADEALYKAKENGRNAVESI
ncbi:hypothetical protein CP965_12320 [Halarcobacter mediterraneus]|uniref:diguanylate cyclase n=1 Tax=Halarcobacter mediterraneus TaxID=2023153 RepID=A0A4Q1B280_9BACT|nr:hypothetical protein CP965_12320 [Halarcobacter mediterraneus]